jgi:hypothetical protein
MKKYFKKAFLMVLGLSMAIGFGITHSRLNSTGGGAINPIEVSAAPEKTSASAIRITVDKGDWGWSNLHIYCWSPTVDEGYSFDCEDWRGYPLVTPESGFPYYEFPYYVSAVNFIINADEEGGSANKETHAQFVDARGDYLVDTFQWYGGAIKASVTVTRTGDYNAEIYPITSGHTAGIDSTRTRIWLYRGHYGTDDAIVVLNIDDTWYSPSGYVHAWDVGDSHHHYLPYFDIPLDLIIGEQFNFLKINMPRTAIWNTSSTLTYATGDSSYLFKLPEDVGDTLTKSTVTQTITNWFFAKVLEGYLTCSDNLDNGYSAFSAIDSNFLPRDEELWDMVGNLGDIDITDYAGEGTSGYASSRGTGVQVNAYAKYLALQRMYDASPNGGSVGNIGNLSSERYSLIALIALISLGVGLSGYYFTISRKKIKI